MVYISNQSNYQNEYLPEFEFRKDEPTDDWHKIKITVDMVKVSHKIEKIGELYEDDFLQTAIIYFGLETTHFSRTWENIEFYPKDAILVHIDGIPLSKIEQARINWLKWDRSYKARVERERFKGTVRKFEKKIFSYKQISLEEIANYFYKLSMKAVYKMSPKDRREYFRFIRREREERERKKREQLIKKGLPPHVPPPGYKGLSAFFGD